MKLKWYHWALSIGMIVICIPLANHINGGKLTGLAFIGILFFSILIPITLTWLFNIIEPPSSVIGRRGQAICDLSPAGNARFDNEIINVIAKNKNISKGREIEIVKVNKDGVFVKEIPV